jgi:hypothetical protein
VEVQNVLIASGNIGDTMTDYDITQGIWYNDTYIGTLGEPRSIRILICPECENHNHGGTQYYDCKNVFYMTDRNGVKSSVAQCQCYSKEHGVRC